MAQFVVSSYQLQKWALSIRHGQDAASYAPVVPFTGEDEREQMARSLEEIKDVLKTQGDALPFDEHPSPKRAAT